MRKIRCHFPVTHTSKSTVNSSFFWAYDTCLTMGAFLTCEGVMLTGGTTGLNTAPWDLWELLPTNSYQTSKGCQGLPHTWCWSTCRSALTTPCHRAAAAILTFMYWCILHSSDLHRPSTYYMVTLSVAGERHWFISQAEICPYSSKWFGGCSGYLNPSKILNQIFPMLPGLSEM